MEKINLYTITIPPMMKSLDALKGLLIKLEGHANSKQQSWQEPNAQEKALLGSHLISDQFPLCRQIQIACDNAKGGAARLAQLEIPKHEDTETTVAELKERISKTHQFLESIKPEQVIGNDDLKISLPYWDGKSVTAFEYVAQYLLPNFYFHITTAYSILRKNGVGIGKSDYMGVLPLE
jgi:hypothetical protein